MAKPARRMGIQRTFLTLSSKGEEKDDPPTGSRFCAGQQKQESGGTGVD
jgi:hypothetical protein